MKYFDKIYGYICNGSVCPCVLFQMLFRIRILEDENILSDSKVNMKSWSNIVPFGECELGRFTFQK